MNSAAEQSVAPDGAGPHPNRACYGRPAPQVNAMVLGR